MQDENQIITSKFREAFLGTSNGNKLVRSFGNAIAQRAGAMIDNEVTCKEHRGQPLVGFDPERMYFGCQQCLYDGEYEDPLFITARAREIHDQFRINFDQFEKVQERMEEIQPQVVTQNIRIQVSQFFNKLKHKLDEVEMGVMQKIKHSKNLQSFLESADKLQDDVNDEVNDMVEEEGNLVFDKIQQNKFAFLVIKGNYYDKLNGAMEKMNEEANQEIDRILQLETQIVSMIDNESLVLNSLTDLVSNVIQIDETKPDLTGFVNPEESKMQIDTRLKENDRLGFVLKQDRVFSVDLLDQKVKEIDQIHHQYFAKLMPIDNKSLLVLGGQSQPVKGGRENVVKRGVHEILWDKSIGRWEINRTHDFMNRMRVGFGATWLKNKDYLMVSGGYTICFQVSDECEVYKFKATKKERKWTKISSMNEKRTAHSICEVDQYVYAFGGLDQNEKSLNSIERLRLPSVQLESTTEAWEMIDVTLPSPICNIGCFALSANEILLFGGLNPTNQQMISSGTILLTVDNAGKHSFQLSQIPLQDADVFPVTQVQNENDTTLLVYGKGFVHAFTNDPAHRGFKTQFRITMP